MDLLVSLSLS
jgi:hypothetical protein